MDESRIRRGRKPSGPLPMPTIKMPPREDASLDLEDRGSEGQWLTVWSPADKSANMTFQVGSTLDAYEVDLSPEQVLDVIEFLQLRTGTWR